MASSSSSTSGRKFEWLVICPDKPGALAKRLEVRPKHIEGMVSLTQSGVVKMGGAILNEVPPSDDTPPSDIKFCGSSFVIVASTREEVLDVVRKDVYVQEGVFDLDKIQMWPFKCAFRCPM